MISTSHCHRRSERARPPSLCAIALVASAALTLPRCAPIDRRPPFRRPEYVEAFRQVAAGAVNARRSSGPFSAGWARVPIQVPLGTPLAGFGDRRGAPSEGTLDPAYVRAFAISAGDLDIVIFTADVLLISPEVVEAVMAALHADVGADSLFFTASHTHSGPGAYVEGTLWEIVLGPYDPRAFDAIVSAHVSAARTARASRAPARIGSGSAFARGLVQNRVERGGLTDDRLFAVAFERTSDGKKAALWSFACHAVTLDHENLRISADYPGVVAKAFEESGDYDIVGYAAGGVGSSNPKLEHAGSPEWMTAPLIRALRKALLSAHVESRDLGALARARVTVPLPPPRYRFTRSWMIAPPLVSATLPIARAPLGAIAIDDTVLLHVPAELSGELTRIARADAARAGIRLGIFPFNGSYVGYVVPRRVYDLSPDRGDELLEYETQTMSFFGPWAGDLIMNLALRLAAGVHHAARAEGANGARLRSGAPPLGLGRH